MRQIYVCGPYTHPTDEGTRAHIRSALSFAHALVQAGWLPIVPHTMGPHRMTWEEAMCRCRYLIQGLDIHRDALVTLPGWTESRGSREEVLLAESRGLRILNVKQALEGL